MEIRAIIDHFQNKFKPNRSWKRSVRSNGPLRKWLFVFFGDCGIIFSENISKTVIPWCFEGLARECSAELARFVTTSFIMITFLVTLPSLCIIYWLKTQWHRFFINPTHLIWPLIIYFCFLGGDLKGKWLAKILEGKRRSKNALKSIQKDEHKRCFQQWKIRLNKVININGEYFKGG